MAGRTGRAATAAAILLAALTAASCSSSSADAAFAPYQSATLVAGEGLGDLRLGETTLASFVARFPGGVPSALAGDELGAELAFPDVGLAFLFAIEGDCHAAVSSNARSFASDLAAPDDFFARVPACRDAPLHSISVRAASSPEDTFFAGRTDAGVSLWSALADLEQAEGPDEDLRGLWLADSRPDDGRLTDTAYSRGIAYAVGEAPGGESAGRLVVRRMAIFRAE